MTNLMVCGCPWQTHTAHCHLGHAERIALGAVADARGTNTNQLLSALMALRIAGVLRDLPEEAGVLEGLLDCLWECGLIGPDLATSDGAG